jgi:hypothetical protein
MVSANISELYCWGNQRYPLLSGALGPSPSHGGGLGALFYLPVGLLLWRTKRCSKRVLLPSRVLINESFN